MRFLAGISLDAMASVDSILCGPPRHGSFMISLIPFQLAAKGGKRKSKGRGDADRSFV